MAYALQWHPSEYIRAGVSVSSVVSTDGHSSRGFAFTELITTDDTIAFAGGWAVMVIKMHHRALAYGRSLANY